MHFLPDDDGGSGWWRLLETPTPATPLIRDLRVPALVLGAGFTGLAVARTLALARPDWEVCLVDAQRVGYGASGRNSGFVGDLAHRNPRVTQDETARFTRVARRGAADLDAQIRDHAIDCQWSHIGRLHVARGPTSRKNLKHLLAFLERFDVAHQPLSAAELEGRIGTPYYAAGVRLPDSYLVQPAALARGLAATLPCNVKLCEETPLLSLCHEGSWIARTPSGTVTADNLYIAAGGFARGLDTRCPRVVPLLTFGSLTRPLTEAQSEAMGGEREWGLVSEDRMGTSIRRTQCDRLLVRSRVRFRNPPRVAAPDEAIVQAHAEALRARWPALELPLEFSWGGVMSMTLNQGFAFGERGPGLYVATGYNGTGVAMGTALGAALAELSLGARTPLAEDALALPSAGWTPPDLLLGAGVRLYTKALQWRATGD